MRRSSLVMVAASALILTPLVGALWLAMLGDVSAEAFKKRALETKPDRVVLYESTRCLLYEAPYRGAPLFFLICDDGSRHAVRDWLYQSQRM